MSERFYGQSLNDIFVEEKNPNISLKCRETMIIARGPNWHITLIPSPLVCFLLLNMFSFVLFVNIWFAAVDTSRDKLPYWLMVYVYKLIRASLLSSFSLLLSHTCVHSLSLSLSLCSLGLTTIPLLLIHQHTRNSGSTSPHRLFNRIDGHRYPLHVSLQPSLSLSLSHTHTHFLFC